MSTPQLTPGERLALSRERLRAAVLHNATQAAPPFAAFLSGGGGLLELLKTALPGSSVIIDALTQWWEKASLRPLAQRHPVALVAVALIAGAVLAWGRPWRWLFRPPLLTSLGPALLTSVLASGALQAWISEMLVRASTKPAAPEPAGDSEGG